jgi:tRNA A-37 threonylcarbamoyl transferase component Bud32
MTDAFRAADEWRPLFGRHRLSTMAAWLTTIHGQRVSWRYDGLETIRVDLSDDSGRTRSCFLKRYAAYRGLWSYYWRVRRLRREIDALRWLAERSFPAPVLIAWGVRRHWGMVTAACLVTAGLDDVRTLENDPAGRFAPVLARLIGRLHRAGFFHGNLYARNILFRPSTGDLFLIDFPACRIEPPWPITSHAAVRDLSCLLHDPVPAAADDAVRFIAAYVEARWPEHDQAARVRIAGRLERRIRLHAAVRRSRLRWLEGKEPRR